MKKNIKTRFLVLGFGVMLATSGFAQESQESQDSVMILAPYVGTVKNVYQNPGYHLDIGGSGTMAGLYFQQIQPEQFQWNTFLYLAPEVNSSKVTGIHLNGDHYFPAFESGKIVAGLDVENIRVAMDAPIPGLETFKLNTDVLYILPRAGVSIPWSASDFRFTIFPYAGYTYERVSGDVTLNPMGPAPESSAEFSKIDRYATIGTNFSVYFSHFLNVHLKYMAGLKEGESLDSYSLLVNGFLSRSFGLSYRYKRMEIPNGSDAYHLFGVAFLF